MKSLTRFSQFFASRWLLWSLVILSLLSFSFAQSSPSNLSTGLSKVAAQIGPSTVMLGEMETQPVNGTKMRGIGSGIWVQDRRGQLYILTNAHVVEGLLDRMKENNPESKAALRNDPGLLNFAVRLYTGSDLKKPDIIRAKLVKLPDGQYAESPWQTGHDLALLKPLYFGSILKKIRPVAFRDLQKEHLYPLEDVIAVGAPQNWSDTFTMGHISNPERLHPDEPENIFIQHDAPINGGNSGGGLYDEQGRLIGINSRKPPSIEEGVSFSIRVDVVEKVLEGWGVAIY